MKLYFVISVFAAILILSSSTMSNVSNVNPNFADSLQGCPVTGDAITSGDITLRYVDRDIVFCNEGCMMAFKKEPAKFTEHLLCMPCSDPDGKKDINTVHNGVKYYFCNQGCKKKFEADAEKYLEKFKEN